MRKFVTLTAVVSVAAVLTSSCAGNGQPGATSAPTATTTPTEGPSTPASDDADELRPGAWVEVLTQADCLDVYALPQLTEEKVACLPPGFVGMLADEPIQLTPFRPTWWPLAGLGWVQESGIRFHHTGDLPYPSPDPDLSLAGEITFRGPDGGLWLMKADTSDRRLIGGIGSECAKECTLAPSLWSPNGQMIVLAKNHPSESKVVDTSGQTMFSVSCSDPVWAPTSRLLAVACINTFAQLDLSVFNLDGEVVHNIPSASMTNWASDGRRLALVRRALGGDDRDLLAVPAIFDVETGELMTLDDEMPYSELLEKGSPLWSPEGAWLAYDHRLTNVDTGEVRQLPGRIDGWSPNARFLLLDDTQIYDLEKGESIGELELSAPLPESPLSRPAESPEQLASRLFAWSPDGQFAIQFIRRQDPERPSSVLRIIELKSGHVRAVVIPVPASEPELSPDGQYLVVSPEVDVTWGGSGYLFPDPEGKWCDVSGHVRQERG